MREIKFRAWDKTKKKMHKVCRLGLNGYSSDFWSLDPVCCETTGGRNKEDFVFMQYTGLKDKNGKGIYEGDIIEAYFYYDEESDKKAPKNKKVFAVEYRVDDGRQFAGFDFFPSKFEYIEVIGNIHENPELLTGGPSHDQEKEK